MPVDTERLIRDLSDSRFWGVLELKFQSGKVTTIRKTETLVTQDYEFGRHPRHECREASSEQYSR